VTKYIEHIVEPERLLLSWQPRESTKGRMRRFVGELIRRGDDADLVYLRDTEDFKQACEMGFNEYPGFPISEDHRGVLASFMKRLPPRQRTDFGRYLASFRIQESADISDFALLGYSRAKLPDDDFTIIHPFDMAEPPFELLLPIEGYRYRQDNLPFGQLEIGLEAHFEKEPENPRDPQAIRIVIRGMACGYVCRGLTEQFHKWMDRGYSISATIERLNGTPEKPMIYLYVAVQE
jgi:hypothetical protein